MGRPAECGHSIYAESCPSCRRLRGQWYAHIKNNGFDDIENLNGDIVAHGRASEVFDKSNTLSMDLKTPETFFARASYYIWCSQMVETGRFDSARDKMIWEFHADGCSRRKIAAFVELEQSYVTRKIQKIQHSLVNQVIGSVSLAEGSVFKAI